MSTPSFSADAVAIVLAGGASSRFGSDKLAASLDGRPLLHHALEAVAQITDRVVVVIAPEAPLPSVPRGMASRVVFARDTIVHGGPLAGLASGLAVAAAPTPVRGTAPRFALVVGGDMPSLVPFVLRLLVDGLGADPNLAALTLEAPHPAPLPMAVRPNAALAAIELILASGGTASLRALLEAVPSATVPAAAWRAADPAGATLRDVDTPADITG